MFHSAFVANRAIQDFLTHPVGKSIVDRNREGIVGELHHQGRGHVRAKSHCQDQGQNMVEPQKRTGPGQDSRDKTPCHRPTVKRPQIRVDPVLSQPLPHLSVLKVFRTQTDAME